MVTRYVARNAFLPMYTTLLIRIGGVFGGSVILETIFQYRGMGFYIFQAFSSRDYPLMMGGFIVTTAVVIFALVIADFTYGWLDPRISQGGEHESF
jgi:peptide/nickel transport system permease protein